MIELLTEACVLLGWREDVEQRPDWLRLHHNARGGNLAKGGMGKDAQRAARCPPSTSGVLRPSLKLRFWPKKMRTVRESGVASDGGGASVVKSCLGFK